MRIRTQNLLAIVPLFVGLAVLSGGLTYTLERGEILWGMNQQVSALAVATAEFIDGDSLRNLMTGEDSAYGRRLVTPFRRILMYNQAQRIFALTSDAGGLVFSVDSSLFSVGKEGVGVVVRRTPYRQIPGLAVAMRRDSVYVEDVHDLASGEEVMTAYAPILNSAGMPVAVLGVDISADGLIAKSRALFVRVCILAACVVVLGLAASLFLSGMFTRKIRQLSLAADEVSGGNLDLVVNIGTIQEVSDLSNTFNTMSSVLKNVLLKIRRALIEGEQFRTRADVANAYVEEFWKPVLATSHGTQVAGAMIGAGRIGLLLGAEESDGVWRVLVGRVGRGRDVETATRASAVYTYIMQEVRRHDPARVIGEAVTLFEVERLEYLQCVSAASTADLWSYDAQESAEAVHFVSRFEQGLPICVHTFSGETAQKVVDYVHTFRSLTPAELVEDITLVIEQGIDGCFIIAGRV